MTMTRICIGSLTIYSLSVNNLALDVLASFLIDVCLLLFL